MRHRMVKPTCCWGQLRTGQVHLQTAEEAVVEAQVGVDVKPLGDRGASPACLPAARGGGGTRDTGGLPDQALGVPARLRLVVVTDRRRIHLQRRSPGEP